MYQCRDGKWIAVAAIEQQFHRSLWQRLADSGIDMPDSLEQLEAQQWQREFWPSRRQALAAAFAVRNRDEWCDLFSGCDACVAPVLSLAEAQRHPHNVARGSFLEVAGIAQPAPAPRLSVTAGAVGSPPDSAPIGIEEALRMWR